MMRDQGNEEKCCIYYKPLSVVFVMLVMLVSYVAQKKHEARGNGQSLLI